MNTQTLDDSLARMAELCRQLIARAAPVRFALAQTDAERTAIYRLRYETIVERGWARPEDIAGGLERDEYDASAVHVVGMDGGALAACARLVYPAPGLRLPTEQAFDIQVEPRGRAVDLSRQIVARAYSSNQHAIFAGLLSFCWMEVQARGYYHVCGDFTASMIRLYRIMGLGVTTLGPARLFWGEQRFPIVQDVLGAVSIVTKRWLGSTVGGSPSGTRNGNGSSPA
jgi:N-acyl-L-homoserine lactone synthetase